MKQGTIGALALTAMLALASCGTTVIDQGKLEDQISEQLGASAVKCPDDEEAKKGNKFECSATTVKPSAPGTGKPPDITPDTIEVEVQNEDGDVEFKTVE